MLPCQFLADLFPFSFNLKVFDRVQTGRQRPALHFATPPKASLTQVKYFRDDIKLLFHFRLGRESIGSELGSVGEDGEAEPAKEGGRTTGAPESGGGGGWHVGDQEPQPPPRKRGGSPPGDG